MDNYKQLYEKTSEEYKEFYPLTDILSIIDKESGKNLKQLLNQYNHIKLDWKGNTVDTRNSVPLILRHKGLFITYDTGSNIVTEYYTGDDISVSINTIWQNDNNWTNFSIAAGLADQEDITEVNGKFKFADRNHNAAQFTGMGRVILRKNLVDVGGGTVKNVLTQDMINKSNTIYEIRYDFDLNGEEITIPEGCILDFQGGSLSNGSVVGDNTVIKAELVKIFSLDVNLSGNWKIREVYPEWFGAIGNGILDDRDSIIKSIEFSYLTNKTVYLTTTYLINNDIEINYGLRFSGNYVHSDIVQYKNNSCLLVKDCNGFILNGTIVEDGANEKGTDIIFENVRLRSNYSADFIHTHCAGRPPRLARFKNCDIEYFETFVTLHSNNKDTSWGIMEFDNCLMHHNFCVLKTDSESQSYRTITNLMVHNCNISSLNSENPVFDLQYIYGPITITNCIAESIGCLLKVTNATLSAIEISKNYFEAIRGFIVDISSISVRRNSFKFTDNNIHMAAENIRLRMYLFKLSDFSGNVYYNTSNEYDDIWDMIIYGCEIGCNIPYYSFNSSLNFFSFPFEETSLLSDSTMFIPTSASRLSNGAIGYSTEMSELGARAVAFYANKDIPAGSTVIITGWKKGDIAITIKDVNRINNVFPKITISSFADYFAEKITTIQPIEKGKQYSMYFDLGVGNIELSGLCVHVIPDGKFHSLNKYLIYNKKNWVEGLKGNSSERPMQFDTGNGQEYYDSDLGKKIYFYGSWKDATGVDV